ncbi:MAG: biotin/lipoyl-containing protein, partial [Limisphaerales bacterium]
MDVKLPKLGEGADSGVVVNVFVKEGDTIASGQAIIELENEKAVASIQSTATGKVTAIFVKSGDRISIGQKLISVEGGGSAAASAPTAAPKPAAKKVASKTEKIEDEDEHEGEEENVTESGDENVSENPVASPSVRKIARELGIDLRKVRGSESGGRIVTGDLRNYIQRLVASSAKGKSSGKSGAPAKPIAEQIDFSQWGPILKKPLTQLRQVISRRMAESWNAVPRVTQFDEADFTKLNELR